MQSIKVPTLETIKAGVNIHLYNQSSINCGYAKKVFSAVHISSDSSSTPSIYCHEVKAASGGGMSKKAKLAIGLGVGLGVGFLC
jgi:hypothetical protein